MELAEDSRSRITGRLVMGVVVILLGVIFLLDQLHVAPAKDLLRFLPGFPLLLGLMLLTGIGFRRHVAGGLVLTVVSTFLLLRALGVLNVHLWMLWPVALIAIGGWLVVASVRGPASRDKLEKGASTIEAFALWSGSTRKVVSEDFRAARSPPSWAGTRSTCVPPGRPPAPPCSTSSSGGEAWRSRCPPTGR
jgi:hypothetical protein